MGLPCCWTLSGSLRICGRQLCFRVLIESTGVSFRNWATTWGKATSTGGFLGRLLSAIRRTLRITAILLDGRLYGGTGLWSRASARQFCTRFLDSRGSIRTRDLTRVRLHARGSSSVTYRGRGCRSSCGCSDGRAGSIVVLHFLLDCGSLMGSITVHLDLMKWGTRDWRSG